jgi:hypothetical protein
LDVVVDSVFEFGDAKAIAVLDVGIFARLFGKLSVAPVLPVPAS